MLATPSFADAEQICTLINRSFVFDGEPRVFLLEELLEEFAEPHFELTEHARVYVRDGQLVGWVTVNLEPSGVALERAIIGGTVDPAHRGTGVGRALLEWATQHATARLQAIDNGLPKYIRVYNDVEAAAAHRLLARFGFRAVRWFDELLLDLTDRRQLPAGALNPPGCTIVAWPAPRSDEILAVKNAAFDDHWGSIPTDAASWAARLVGHGCRPDLSFVALDDEVIVGMCLNAHYPQDEEVLGRRDGWIETLATLRSHRGRGIATALIAHSLEAFVGAGLTHASLGVDADNPTGASRLYRNLGFAPSRQEVVSELQVA